MPEALNLVLDAWIERYCIQLCGGHDSDATEQLYHNVQTTQHLTRTFRAAAVKHVGTATIDVPDEFEPTVDAFLAEVTDHIGDISLGPSTVIAVKESIAESELDAFKRDMPTFHQEESDDEDDPEL